MTPEQEKRFDELFAAPEFDPPFVKHAVRTADIKDHISSLLKEERARIAKSVNDKDKQEQILANLLLRIVREGQEYEIEDSSLLDDLVVFEYRDTERMSTIYRVERNSGLTPDTNQTEVEEDTPYNREALLDCLISNKCDKLTARDLVAWKMQTDDARASRIAGAQETRD